MDIKPVRSLQSSGKQILFLIISALIPLEAWAAVGYLVSIPRDINNIDLFGFSWERLIVIGLLLAASIFFLAVFIRGYLHQDWREKLFHRLISSRLVGMVLMGYFLGVGSLCLTPAYRYGIYGAYFERLFPLLLWTVITSAQVLILIIAGRHQVDPDVLGQWFNNNRRIFSNSGLVLFIMVVVWLFIGISGMGIRPDTQFWNEAGIPISFLQVIIILAATILALILTSRLRIGKREWKGMDLVIFVGIWILAAAAWGSQPVKDNFFAPGPYAPNNEYYPFSDAMNYDVSAQYALIGRGYNNQWYVDKPFYSALLTVIHLAAGQNFNQVTLVQVCLLAVLPAILYLMGKTLSDRLTGLVLAGVVIIQQINMMEASSYVQVSHVRLFLSEFPLSVLLALFTLAFIRAYKNPEYGYTGWLLAGGFLGLSTLVRHNPWLLLPGMIGIAFFVFWKKWKRWIKVSLIFICALFVSISPWMWQNYWRHGQPFYFLGPLVNVVWNNRLAPSIESTPVEETPEVTPQPTPISMDPQSGGANRLASPIKLVPTAIPAPTAIPSQTSSGLSISRIGTLTQIISGHFFHNLLSPVFLLPISPVNDDIETVLRSPGSPWDVSQFKSLALGAKIFLFLNLAVLALGIGTAFRRWEFAGLAPLWIYVLYALAAAAARTSGGRYIVPVQWIVLLYFSIGLVWLAKWLITALGWTNEEAAATTFESQKEQTEISQKMVYWNIILMMVFFLVGSTVPIIQNSIPDQFPKMTKQQMFDILDERGVIQKLGISQEEAAVYIQDKNSVLSYGEILYPRFYKINQGEPQNDHPLRSLGYPRLTFMSIGSGRNGIYVLPLDRSPKYFPQGAKAVILGCKSYRKLDAAVVVILGENDTIYTRIPSAPLKCPLPEPVCDDNRNCK